MNTAKKSKNKPRGFGSQSRQSREKVALATQFLIEAANGAKPQMGSQYGIYFITNAYLDMLNISPEILLRQVQQSRAGGFHEWEQVKQIAVLQQLCDEIEARHKQQLKGLAIDELSLKIIELNAVASTVCRFYILALHLGKATLGQVFLDSPDIGGRCFGIVEDAARYIESHVSRGLPISSQLLDLMNGADTAISLFADRDPRGHGSQFNVINGFAAKTFIYLDENIAVNRTSTDLSDVNISVRHSDGFWRYTQADRPIPFSSIRNAKCAIQRIIDSGEVIGGQISPDSAKFVEHMGFTIEGGCAYTNAQNADHQKQQKILHTNLLASAENFVRGYEQFTEAFSQE
jgi:hypothetical protein